MSTFMANAANIERKWYVVDAANKPCGRVAAEVAVLLRGKHKATFTPHVDCGDFVIVVNADKVIFTLCAVFAFTKEQSTNMRLSSPKYSTLTKEVGTDVRI